MNRHMAVHLANAFGKGLVDQSALRLRVGRGLRRKSNLTHRLFFNDYSTSLYLQR